MTPENTYIVDFNLLGIWNIPKRLRKIKTFQFVRLLVSPFIVLYQEFIRFRKATIYDLMITPQVCYLETMLNDRFDFTQRRIYIADGEEKTPLYLYTDPELQPVNLYTESENQPEYLFLDAEVDGTVFDDFVVMVPLSLVFDQNEMRGMVQRKKLPSMRFRIQTF